MHSHPSKFVLKPSRDRKGRGNSAITLNSRQLAEHDVLMPLSMERCSWQVFSKGIFYCWERGAEMKVRNALIYCLLVNFYSSHLLCDCSTSSLFKIYLPQTEKCYSLGHVMCKSKLQNLLQSGCRLDLVFLFQVLLIYVMWSSASFPLRKNGHPPYDTVIAAHR